MHATAARIPQGLGRQAGMTDSWPSLLVTALVAAAAIYSFAPRPIPPFPETRVHPDQLLVNGLAQNGGRLLAAGEQGRILVSTDAGTEWHEAQVIPQRGSTFTQLRFVDGKLALAVGHDGWIVRSTDAGETWKEVHFDAQLATPLMGVAGPYDGRLFAYGGFGLLLVSGDAGQTWQTLTDTVIGDHHLNAMTQAADGALWIAGERGLLVRSTDNGQSWKAQPSIYGGSFYGLLSLPSRELVVYGMRGNVFYSRDLGASWRKSAVPGELSLFGGNVGADGAITLVGEAEVVLRSTDGGAHFKQLSEGERKRLTSVLPMAQPGQWMVAGESGIAVLQLAGKAAASPERQP